MRRRNGVLAAVFFSDFGTDSFPLKISFLNRFEIVVFLFWSRDPVLELQISAICGDDVRGSIVFRNAAAADRSGMAASKFIISAAAMKYCCIV